MDDRYDEMTKVLNRNALWHELDRLVETAQNNSQPLSVVMMDLDEFKKFNDTQGHLMGDELIKRFASVLQSNCRPSDVLARYGGEEFIIAMPDTHAEEALLMMDDVRRQISSTTFTLETTEKTMDHRFTFSGGIACYPKDGKDHREVIRAADSALYRAKVNGRDRLALAVKTRMILKSNYYSKTQLDKLSELANKTQKTEAFLLREALDDVLAKYLDKK